MSRYALVKTESGIVENVILIDDPAEYEVPEGYEIVDEKPLVTGIAAINGTWDGTKFGPDPNIPPLA